VFIHRDDIKEILNIMEKFPDSQSVEIVQDSSSGIGSELKIRIPTIVNNYGGIFEIDLTDVSKW
jgi:hypothetical protein